MPDGYPGTRHDMLRAGYTLVYSRPCSKCRVTVDRWRTRNGKEITMDHNASDYADVQPHRATCKGLPHGHAQPERPVLRFARETRAAAVVIIDRLGHMDYTVDVLADPADTHTTLTCAADAVRDFLVNHQNGSN